MNNCFIKTGFENHFSKKIFFPGNSFRKTLFIRKSGIASYSFFLNTYLKPNDNVLVL